MTTVNILNNFSWRKEYNKKAVNNDNANEIGKEYLNKKDQEKEYPAFVNKS